MIYFCEPELPISKLIMASILMTITMLMMMTMTMKLLKVQCAGRPVGAAPLAHNQSSRGKRRQLLLLLLLFT